MPCWKNQFWASPFSTFWFILPQMYFDTEVSDSPHAGFNSPGFFWAYTMVAENNMWLWRAHYLVLNYFIESYFLRLENTFKIITSHCYLSILVKQPRKSMHRRQLKKKLSIKSHFLLSKVISLDLRLHIFGRLAPCRVVLVGLTELVLFGAGKWINKASWYTQRAQGTWEKYQ